MILFNEIYIELPLYKWNWLMLSYDDKEVSDKEF
jgi:hypothetical protein